MNDSSRLIFINISLLYIHFNNKLVGICKQNSWKKKISVSSKLNFGIQINSIDDNIM